ncbi:ATP-grasp fold amidoligase family protein [Enterococcus faecium]|uniref:ATP-grasp fold amidoligase family protein n=1 Tax=Enterococcus faecium TaxID=1352 RepID=UPI003D7FBCB4
MKEFYIRKRPISYTKYQYKKYYEASLDLIKPQKLSEKIQYLKLLRYPYDEKVVLAADKYTLHEYLGEKGLLEYAVPFYKVYDNAEQINFNQLPEQFVIKKTNASGMNLIVKDKDKVDTKEVKSIVKGWMKKDFGSQTAEYHYSAATPRIICEPFLNLGDEFRLFMVGGNLAFIQVIKWDWTLDEDGKKNVENDLIKGHKKHYRLHFDSKGNLLWSDDGVSDLTFTPPIYWSDLKEIAKKISNDFPVVRIDFNDVDGQPKITELTFTPASGFLEILRNKPELDMELGKWLSKEI